MVVEPVSAERSLQERLSVETSTRYPLIAAPPSSAGGVQERSMRVCPFAVAVTPVGGSGKVASVPTVIATAAEQLLVVSCSSETASTQAP